MSFSRVIALRYLKSNRANRYFSWITLLSLLGLAIGVAALIVVISVINGFEFELRSRFLHANAHIMAYRYPAGMVDPERWSRMLERDFKSDVRGTSPFVHYETMAKHGPILHGVLIRGIAPKLREKVQSLRELVQPASALAMLQAEMDSLETGGTLPAVPHIIVGSGLLGILNAKVGDTILLIAPSENRISDTKQFKIIGTYNSGLKHYDNRLIAMSLSAAKDFFNMGKVVTGLEIGLYDPERSPIIARKMEEKYNLSFREWQSYNRPLFEAMERERFVISIIVAMVVVVASFNILTTVFVSVSQRQRDISILKALGARNRQIMSLFMLQSLSIGAVGSILGIILAAVVSYLLETYPFIDLPEPYFLKSLPVHYSASVYLGVSGAATIVCLVAGLYPAIIASRVIPTEGIKGTGQAL